MTWDVVVDGTAVPIANYGATWVGMSGVGMPQVENKIAPYGLAPGGVHQRTAVPPRSFILQAVIPGQSLPDLHTLRARLVETLRPDRTSPQQPVTLRYSGGTRTVEIDAYYDAGLEFENPFGYTDRLALRFVAPDPFFRSTTFSTAAINTNTASNGVSYVNALVRYPTGTWQYHGRGIEGVHGGGQGNPAFLVAGVGTLSLLAIPLRLDGTMQTRTDGATVQLANTDIAGWNGSSWVSYAPSARSTFSGTQIIVHQVAQVQNTVVIASGSVLVNGTIYGSSSGFNAVQYYAYASLDSFLLSTYGINGWRANAIYPFTYGTHEPAPQVVSSNAGSVITFGISNGNFIIRLSTPSAIGSPHASRAFFPGSSSGQATAERWLDPLFDGSGTTRHDQVTSVVANHQTLYATHGPGVRGWRWKPASFGDLTNGTMVPIGVTAYSGSIWTSIGTTETTGVIRTAALDPYGILYVGGSFQTMNGIATGPVARWNGRTWTGLATGLLAGSTDVRQLVYDPQLNRLYAVGVRTPVNDYLFGIPHVLASWNNSTWEPLEPRLLFGTADTPRFVIGFNGYVGLNIPTNSFNAQSGTISIVVSTGTSRTKPRITINSFGRVEYLANITTNQYVPLSLDVRQGETLVLDFEQQLFASSIHGNIINNLPMGAVLNDFTLAPGTNLLVLLCKNNSPPIPTTAAAQWQNRYWSVDT